MLGAQRTVPGDRGQFFITFKDDFTLDDISPDWRLTHRVRHRLCLPGIFDHLIHLRMRAQEAISKRHCVRTGLGPLLWALPKMIYTDLHNPALRDAA